MNKKPLISERPASLQNQESVTSIHSSPRRFLRVAWRDGGCWETGTAVDTERPEAIVLDEKDSRSAR